MSNQTTTTTTTATEIAHEASECVECLPTICHTGVDTRSIVRITLEGPILILSVIGLCVGVHIFSPSLIASLITSFIFPYIIYNDYRAYLGLGPGGTPSTFIGYLKITYLRLFTLSFDPFEAPVLEGEGSVRPANGHLQQVDGKLPEREGLRPLVAGIAPQRQLDQPGSLRAHLAVRAALTTLAINNPYRLRTGVSCFEKQGLALFSHMPVNDTCRGEICHVHHSDRSFHMNLHPHDAAVVLQKGWGQRHPLACGGWVGRYVPKEFVMVYAPRNEDEVKAVLKIVECAAWWVTGERFEINVPHGFLGAEEK